MSWFEFLSYLKKQAWLIAIFDLVAILGLVWRYQLDTNKLKTEIARLKSEITKEKIDKVILLAKYRRDYFALIYQSISINKKFNALLAKTKRPSNQLKVLFDEMDRFIFENVLPSLNELTMIADYFYSDEPNHRLDFIESVIYESIVMIEYHFSYFNRPDILKKSKSEKTIIHRNDFTSVIRFLESSPNSEPKKRSLKLLFSFIETEIIK